MEFWEQALLAITALVMIYLLYPGVRASLEKSRQAQEKHWGTVILLALGLVGFVLLLISLVR
ncbi:MAG: hypothetical protein WBN96_04830 [Gammaproteobacteria bacterium]